MGTLSVAIAITITANCLIFHNENLVIVHAKIHYQYHEYNPTTAIAVIMKDSPN